MGQRPPLVLVVDEVPAIVRYLKLELASQGFDCTGAEIGPDTFRVIEEQRPDIVLLEIVLPGIPGLKLLQELRERYPELPVVMLTTQDTSQDRALTLELGAADYITKPFDPRELALRLSAVLGRGTPTLGTMKLGDVEVDTLRRVVRRGGEVVPLTSNEWMLLLTLVLADRRLAPAEILAEAFGPEFAGETAYLDAWIRHLRKKLELDPRNPQLLVGDQDGGYQFGPVHG
jgi:two-component system KDP operon response regulator KdpE